MKIATGKVVGGKVVVDGSPLDEGAFVTIIARDGNESFDVSPEQKAALLLAIDEADHGETCSADELLQGLPHRRA